MEKHSSQKMPCTEEKIATKLAVFYVIGDVRRFFMPHGRSWHA